MAFTICGQVAAQGQGRTGPTCRHHANRCFVRRPSRSGWVGVDSGMWQIFATFQFQYTMALPVAAEGAIFEVAAELLQCDEVGEQAVVCLSVVERPHAVGLDLTPLNH